MKGVTYRCWYLFWSYGALHWGGGAGFGPFGPCHASAVCWLASSVCCMYLISFLFVFVFVWSFFFYAVFCRVVLYRLTNNYFKPSVRPPLTVCIARDADSHPINTAIPRIWAAINSPKEIVCVQSWIRSMHCIEKMDGFGMNGSDRTTRRAHEIMMD